MKLSLNAFFCILMYFSGVQLLESSIIIAIQLKLSLVTEIAFFLTILMIFLFLILLFHCNLETNPGPTKFNLYFSRCHWNPPSNTERGGICIYYKEASAVKMISISCKNVYFAKLESIPLKDMLFLSMDTQVKIVQTWT